MVNLPDRDGWTPLFWALRNATPWSNGPCQRGELVRHLIAEGAWILIRDNDQKWSPLQVAQYYGHKEDILSQVRPTEEQINAIEDGGEKKWWKLAVAHQPKPADKDDYEAYCDVCLLHRVGTYYTCDKCEGIILCFKCFQSKDMVHPHRFSKYTDGRG